MDQIIEIIGVALAVLYTWLELKQRNLMWWIGIASSLMYVFVTFQSRLYAYMCLYVYYVAVSVYGLWQWKFSRAAEQKELPVSHVTWRHAAALVPLVVGLSIIFSYLLSNIPFPVTIGDSGVKSSDYLLAVLISFLGYVLSIFTKLPIPISMPMLEAVGTALSIVATWMLARKLLEHWLVWIVADSLMAVAFFNTERYPSMLLGLFYAAAAVYGYFAWRRDLRFKI
ncbi:MAG: nicotinamide riboside transporter PnuC [Prevotellaceae bacterium]|jgi:nicotinamide mononucleotide transporter|nr:nicotinamide riboside transporter PnuC [Prevotellaceae bacterium]